jgi:hypothetical protein
MSEGHNALREQDLPAKDDQVPSGFLNKLRGWSEKLDNALRIWDFNLSRTHGGRLHRLAHIDRHTVAALLLPLVLIFLLLLASPDWSARATKAVIWSIVIGWAIWGLMWLSTRQRWSLKVDVCAQALIVLAVAGFLAMRGSSEYDSDSPYFHCSW